MTRIRSSLTLLLAATLVLAACGEDNSVGDAATFEFDQQQAEALGGSTTTTTAVEDTVPDVSTTVARASATTAPQSTTALPPEQQQVSIEVRIQDDSTGQAFLDRIVAIPVGGKVRFLNTSSKVASVVADNGAFNSGDIPPGGVWIWVAEVPGTYNYTDGYRPYAVGTIDVIQ